MKSRSRLAYVIAVLLLTASFLSQETWALAGTTGGLSGYVRESTTGAPLSGAQITVTSASENSSTTTDASGHFSFLSLTPDTYALNVTKTGYQATSVAGITVFADQVQTVSVTMPKELKTIANVTSQAGNLVKPGVGGDIYNVNPTQIQKTATLGGGGNLDSAYSAIASVPGVTVGAGGAGWNQAVIIRGSYPWETGFEYDGIPVNRAFDNYTASTASNLGLQELQVYTGGGPSSISSTGISGFINQVIKTGTYPGFATLTGGLATEAFYHSLRAEAGGATPNRNFSYYVGLSGYDQDFRFVDNNNGASYMTPGGLFGSYASTLLNIPNGQGVFADCPDQGYAVATPAQGCFAQLYGLYGAGSHITDRENIVNLHLGIPRHDNLRDDVQLMWSASALRTLAETAPQDNNINQLMLALTGYAYCAPNGTTGDGCASFGAPNYPFYMDAYAYNVPFGTPIAGVSPSVYYEPSTPQNRAPFAALPLSQDDVSNNDTGVVKLQLTHPLNANSFLRLMGYTFFSDWTQNGITAGETYDVGYAPISPNYDLITHTAGGQLAYVNQINDKNLIQFTGNYTHSSVVRFNNTGFLAPSYLDLYGCPLTTMGIACAKSSPIGYLSQDSSGTYHCWNPSTGNETSCLGTYNGTTSVRPYGLTPGCLYGGSCDIPTSQAVFNAFWPGASNAYVGPTGTAPAGSAAAVAGAKWVSLWDGNASGTYNTVKPDFYSASFEDHWRPSERLNINASLRFDQFTYGMAPANTGQNPFYAQILNSYMCYNPSTNQPYFQPLGPGVFPPPPLRLTATCPAGYSHPGTGGVPLFSLNVPNSYTIRYWEPRLSGTYTFDPDTVVRFSAGRYAEPPISASVEYLYRGGPAINLWGSFTQAGFWSPFHPIPGESSSQYDFSLEHHVHGTQLSFKVTPFYGETSNWEQQSFIGAGFVTQIPVGKARNYGVEGQINYGDFNKNGLSGLLSLTYTQAQVQYQNLLGQNQIDLVNRAIQNYNAMTASGACYTPATSTTFGTPVAGGGPCTSNEIANPYYGKPQQQLLDRNGWYDQGLYAMAPGGVNNNPGFFNAPFIGNLVLNYRHDKFSITPTLQIQAGTKYGSPLNFDGVDPAVCTSNQNDSGVVAGSFNCDVLSIPGLTVGSQPGYGFLYIPNPSTGKFDGVGEFREPNLAVLNLAASYEVSPKVTLLASATNLWHTCFGGSKEPWTSANPPGNRFCGYGANGYFVSNFYNDSSPLDAAHNGGVNIYPWELNTYNPGTGNGTGSYFPFNLYLQAQIKL